MNTSENAPRSFGSTSIAACSTLTSGRAASSAVSRSESVVAAIEPRSDAGALGLGRPARRC